MKIIKAFASHVQFINNTEGAIHPIGEISTDAMTYAKEVGVYGSPDDDSITLVTFTTTLSGNYDKLDSDWTNHVFKVVKKVYEQILTGNQLNVEDLAQTLNTALSSEVSDLRVGRITTDTSKYAPEWVAWKRQGHASEIRIWFADTAFRGQYDDYTVVCVPALPNLADFFKPAGQLRTILEGQTATVINTRVEEAKNRKPPTVTRTFECNWIDPLDSQVKLNTVWTAVVYGAAGDNIDAIKDALSGYILANSDQNRDRWKGLLPDIFLRTEFTLVPLWDQYAIPNRSIVEGIYSPITPVSGLEAKFSPYATEYPAQHRQNHLCLMAHPYRSIAVATCGSHENRDNKFKLTDVYPDYIAEHSLSQDFNRMTEPTREFAEILGNMLVIAEDLDENTVVPQGYSRLSRNGKIFLVRSIGGIHYLMAVKKNFS